MIEPYRTIIANNMENFASLGFNLVKDSDYSMSMSGNGFEILISTEKYYHPSISIALVDASGNEFEVGLLEKIIDPAKFDEDAKTRKIWMESAKNASNFSKQEIIKEYAELCINQVLAFLFHWRHIVLSDLEKYKEEYEKQERLMLGNFGI